MCEKLLRGTVSRLKTLGEPNTLWPTLTNFWVGHGLGGPCGGARHITRDSDSSRVFMGLGLEG
jgi:hypothetical protein